MSSTGGIVSRENEDYMGKGAGGLALRRQSWSVLCFQFVVVCCWFLFELLAPPDDAPHLKTG
jgi:hypothetical protein